MEKIKKKPFSFTEPNILWKYLPYTSLPKIKDFIKIFIIFFLIPDYSQKRLKRVEKLKWKPKQTNGKQNLMFFVRKIQMG